MAGTGRGLDDGSGPWSSSGFSFYSNISSSSGTIVSTAYTSRDSCLSSASAGTGVAMRMHMRFNMGIYEEKTDEQQIKHVRSLVQEFFGLPSVNCCINGGDISVVERWLTDLGVGWLLHLSVGPSARILKLDQWIWPWIRALDEITEALKLMAPLYRNHGPVGLPSICEEEPETERTEASIPDELQLLAQFIQKVMLKMLAFIDIILAPNASTTREVCVSNLSTLLSVRDAVSKALSAIQLLFHSPKIGKIQGEMLSLLSAKEVKVSEAIWTTMEQIRTCVLESMDDVDDSSCSLAPQASAGIHKATRFLMGYISFLQSRYSSVPLIVSEAARLGKYVPHIEQGPPLASMIIEMAACLEEKLANMSESSFVDKGLRFLFLLNNSYFIQEEIKYTFYFLGFPMPALPCKVEGYMKSYLQVSWAPVLSCLLSRTPLFLGRNYSSFSKFEFEFHAVYSAQKQWKIPNPELRETLRKAIIQKLVPGYTESLLGNKVTIPKLSPKELEEMIQDLFEG